MHTTTRRSRFEVVYMPTLTQEYLRTVEPRKSAQVNQTMENLILSELGQLKPLFGSPSRDSDVLHLSCGVLRRLTPLRAGLHSQEFPKVAPFVPSSLFRSLTTSIVSLIMILASPRSGGHGEGSIDVVEVLECPFSYVYIWRSRAPFTVHAKGGGVDAYPLLRGGTGRRSFASNTYYELNAHKPAELMCGSVRIESCIHACMRNFNLQQHNCMQERVS